MYCIDASVLTNSFIEGEEGHKESRKFLSEIKEKGSLVILPELAIPEVAAAISRGTGSSKDAINFVKLLRAVPNFTFVPIDREISNLAAEMAAKKRLRGADAIYAAVSSIFGLTLITRDIQQLERCGDLIKAKSPGKA